MSVIWKCLLVTRGTLAGKIERRTVNPIKNGRTVECKTDNHIPLVVPGVQLTDHMTRALTGSRDEGLTRGSSSSTDVSPADVDMPPPAVPTAHYPATPI